MTPALAVRERAVRAAAVLAGLYLTAGLVLQAPNPDTAPVALALTALAFVVGWLGVVGVLAGETLLAEAGALGVALLGFWSLAPPAVVLPTGVVVAVGAAVRARAERRAHRSESDGDGDDHDAAGDDEEGAGETGADDGDPDAERGEAAGPATDGSP